MVHVIRNIVLFFCCCIVISSVAQVPGITIYTLSGESQEKPRINALYQLKDGYILLGTTKGLYRFDGINFFEFSKSPEVPDDVTAICELPDKNILLGFSNGKIGKLQNNRITLLSFEEGFPKVAITKIIVDERNIIWIATAGEGVYFYRNKRLYNINTDDGLSDNFAYDISDFFSNRVLIATDKGINLCSDDNKKKVIRNFTSRNGLADNIVRCLFPVSNNDIWLGMQDGGISSYNIAKPVTDKKTSWAYGQVNAIMVTSSNVFAGTEENGLLIFNRNAYNNITNLQHKEEQLKKISCLLRDHEGNIWAGGNNQLLRYAGSNIQPLLTLDKKIAENIHVLLWSQKDSSLWFNSISGVISFKNRPGHEVQKIFDIPQAKGVNITSLYQDMNGNIWIGTLGRGVILLDPKTGKQTTLKNIQTITDANIISISGKDSIVWISALEGTVCALLHNHHISFTNYANEQGLGNKYVYSILTDSHNRVWFATDGKGIIRYEKGKFSDLPQPPGGYGNVVYKMVEDKSGSIWFSTYNKGLVKYDGKTFTRFTTAQGLSDMNITGLAGSEDNILLLHKNSIDLINTNSGNIIYFDDEQGINNLNPDLNALTSDAEGNVYFISDSLLFRYNAAKQVILRPRVMIDKIQLFLTDTSVQNGHVFKYNENNLSFYYTGLYYSQPGRIQYQYRLQGYDKDWVSTKDHIKNFPQLPPGDYTFRVRVSLNQNFATSYEANFSFTIAKPIWQQVWFIILSLALFASVLYFIVKQREKEIKKYNRLDREKIQSQLETLRNQINPHFLFNSFNTLISEIEDDPHHAVEYVERLSDFYRNIVIHREKDLIGLEEEIDILNDYCFIQQKRYGPALQIQMLIPLEQQKQYYIVPLALQLLFENAVKHNAISTQNPLHIKLFIENNEQLVICNNINKKFNHEKGSSMGLQNIRKRYQLLRGKTVVVKNDDKFFTVKIPLIQK
jgi:ligand-binding sensor domain-containing protein